MYIIYPSPFFLLPFFPAFIPPWILCFAHLHTAHFTETVARHYIIFIYTYIRDKERIIIIIIIIIFIVISIVIIIIYHSSSRQEQQQQQQQQQQQKQQL